MDRINKWKLPFAAIRRYSSSAIVPKPPTFNFTRPLQPNSSIPFHNLTRSYGFSSSPYHRGFDRRSKKFVWPKRVFAGLALSGGFLYFLLEKKVPYTHRNRILVVTDDFSSIIGQSGLQRHKKDSEGHILPATHPRSVQVCSILENLLGTLHKDLGLNETPIVTCRGFAVSVGKPVIRGKIRGPRTDVGHLKGKKWEVVIVDDPKRRAFSLGDGIIVLHTGLLDSLSDVELATVLAREVGHGVARHHAEGLTLIYMMSFLEKIHMTKFVNINRLSVAYKRRVEIEADYISLLLMASAGYDPHVVLQVYDKVEPYYRNGQHALISKQERVQLLSQPHVVEEALAVYRLATGKSAVKLNLH